MKLTRKFALIPIAAAVMTLGIAGPAAADTANYSFGDLLSGQTGPDNSSTWATLSVTTGAPYTYDFTLTLTSDFSALFGSGAYLSTALFNTASGADPTSVAITDTSGVSYVGLSSNAPLGLGFDFGDCFGGASGGGNCSSGSSAQQRLTSGETVSWTSTFSTYQGDPLAFGSPPMAVHVRSFDSFNNSTSAWYGVTTAVPEPETYAMLLAGLGLMGFVARRRRRREAF